jgi:hypothetical protein
MTNGIDEIPQPSLQARLKQAAQRDHDLDLEIGKEWLAVDLEQWQTFDEPEKGRASHGPNEGTSTSPRSAR